MTNKSRIITAIGCVLLLCLACSKQDNIELVEKYEAAYNSHNVDSIMSLIAEDAVFKLDRRVLKGKEAIRSLAVYDSAIDVRLEMTQINAVGDSVVFDVREFNEWLELAGIDEYHYRKCVIAFDKGLIRYIEARSTEETLVKIGAVFQSIADWMPDSLAFEINDLVQSDFSAESAMRWKKILRQWREETGRT